MMTQPPAARKRTDSKTAEPRRTGVGTQLPERTVFLVEKVGGGTKLASLLGVNKSQPTRWGKGEEQPSPGKAREILDLDHLMARAGLLWEPEVVRAWLTGPNSFLEGARPIDVLRTRGVGDVLEALEAETQMAFG